MENLQLRTFLLQHRAEQERFLIVKIIIIFATNGIIMEITGWLKLRCTEKSSTMQENGNFPTRRGSTRECMKSH